MDHFLVKVTVSFIKTGVMTIVPEVVGPKVVGLFSPELVILSSELVK